MLAQYRPGARLTLETDAAQKTCVGYALWQEEPDGTKRLLRCGSRTVSDAETRYSVTESELNAVVIAYHKLNLYLQGGQFELIMDHKPLVSILNDKCLDEMDSPRIRRLKAKLNGFNMTAVWREGKKHTVVDAFSRHPASAPTDEELEGDEKLEQTVQEFSVGAVLVIDRNVE